MLPSGGEGSSERISMDAIAALPEDVQLMIFSRVDRVEDVFTFAITCKWWMRRFADPAFLGELFKGNDRACLIGFFFQKTRFNLSKRMMYPGAKEGAASISAPTFTLSPLVPPDGPAERSFTSFIPDHGGAFNYAEPLESHHGIILMQLVPHTFELPNMPPVLLSLCNPITGECHFLPPLETPDDDAALPLQVTMNAIITAGGDDRSSLRGVQLLLVTTKGSGQDSEVYLHSYSVDTCSWSTPTRWAEGSRYSLVRDRAAVVHRGAAHWLCTDRRPTERVHRDDENLYKLSVEVGTARLSMTKLPFHAAGSRLLCVRQDDKLSVACIYPMHVTHWTQQEAGDDGGPAPWLRTVVRIAPDPTYSPRPQHPTYRHWFRLSDGSLLALNKENDSYSIYILDLEKKVMERAKHNFMRELERNNDEGYLAFVPYEMDLVKFFVLRLGGICADH